jgi:hypothetical protein
VVPGAHPITPDHARQPARHDGSTNERRRRRSRDARSSVPAVSHRRCCCRESLHRRVARWHIGTERGDTFLCKTCCTMTRACVTDRYSGTAVACDAMGTRSDLQLALRCSDAAAELALTHFEVGVSSTTKADGTPVTEADWAVEHLLRQILGAEAPEDALLGEELGRLGASHRVWILDPIDGTSFFGRGDPNWRVHVALEVAGQTQVAVVTAPALGHQWWATRGGGTLESSWPRDRSTKRLTVSHIDNLTGALLDALDEESPSRGDRLPDASLIAARAGPRRERGQQCSRRGAWRYRTACTQGRTRPYVRRA